MNCVTFHLVVYILEYYYYARTHTVYSHYFISATLFDFSGTPSSGYSEIPKENLNTILEYNGARGGAVG